MCFIEGYLRQQGGGGLAADSELRLAHGQLTSARSIYLHPTIYM